MVRDQMIRRIAGLFSHNQTMRHLVHGTFVSFMIQGSGAGLMFASDVLLARILGVGDYGIYATVLAWIQVLVVVSLVGSNHLLLRYVPAYIAADNWGHLRGVVSFATRSSIVISLSIVFTTVCLLYIWENSFELGLNMAIIAGIAALPFYALAAQRQAILRGLHRVASALFPEHIARPLLLIVLLLLGFWVVKIPVSAHMALGINFLAIGTASMLGWYWQRKAMPIGMAGLQPVYSCHEWLRVAVPLFLIAGMQILITRLDIIMLGGVIGREQAGIYAAASRISDVVVFALASANSIVAPMIAGMYAKNDMQGLQKVMTSLAKGIFIFTIPLVVFIGIMGTTILGIFGPAYQAAYVPLIILVIGQMINALSGPVGFLMGMTGHQQQSLYIFSVATVLNIVLNLILIPSHGMFGAALATGITTVLWNVAMLTFVRRRLGIDSTVLALLRGRK